MIAPNSASDSTPLVQTIITNAPACASLFDLLCSARTRSDHKCADIGSFTIQYSDGKTDKLAVLPGHDPASYEFSLRSSLYRLPREQLYQVLRSAGVDTTRIPESEH